MPSEELTRWTIRLALCGYLGRIFIGLLAVKRPALSHLARWFWTVGCILLGAHIACAFQFYHHWSHSVAYEHTARESLEKVGVNWGGGIWFNYLFLALWTVDTCWWWASEKSYVCRPQWISIALHAYLAFIAFNATVVFETGPVRWLGVLATFAVLVFGVIRYGQYRQSVAANVPPPA